jgi:hypothetical protein
MLGTVNETFFSVQGTSFQFVGTADVSLENERTAPLRKKN